ncbi:hypothetical protein BGW39_003176 [Mortierella sp. 14UC]|nr:hypothetical protein BGW39_003176 [Mortierella sp. 14UC]
MLPYHPFLFSPFSYGWRNSADPALQKRASCTSNTILTWKIIILFNKLYFNEFNFQAQYANGNPIYNRTMTIEGPSNDGEQTRCYKDGHWCVKYSGRDTSYRVTLLYANQEFPHKTPDWNTPIDGFVRDDLLYFDCVHW